MPSGFPSDAHGKHRRDSAASVSLTVPNSCNYFMVLSFEIDCIPDFSMLNQFGESDVHLSSPAIFVLVHKTDYLEVPLYFYARTLFQHWFRVDFIHTRIDIFCLAGIVLWNPNSDVDSMAAALPFVRCTDTSTRSSFTRNQS